MKEKNKNLNILNESEIKILRDEVYNNMQGLCTYKYHEIVEYKKWIHSTHPQWNIEFFSLRIYYNDNRSLDEITDHIKIFAIRYNDKFLLIRNFPLCLCLQDFIIEYFLQQCALK